jgi:WD40 repeat protein
MSRIFISHSSEDNRQAEALREWLVAQDPPLANEIFLDTDPHAGLRLGFKWKDELVTANSRCEVVICLLSNSWESSPECLAEYRTAENMGKQIVCVRLQDGTGAHTAEWQHTDLFVDGLADQDIERIPVRGGPSVLFARAGLHQLREAIRGAGIGADNFVWPPPRQLDRAPYRGWEPFEELDAGVFFGRDAQIVRALDTLRMMRTARVDSLFVVLGPSGSGKSSFLRAGLLPRLRREDRHFVLLDILRPERNALTGETGLAMAIDRGRQRLGLERPALGEIEIACTTDAAAVRELLAECRHTAAQRVSEAGPEPAGPTLILPVDQAEELFVADAGPEAAAFLELIAELAQPTANGEPLGLIVASTIRTDRYELMQNAPQLAGLTSEVFDDLKPMPDNQFREVITSPAARASAGGHKVSIAPNLVNQLLDDAATGGDALPLLALTLRRLYDRYASTGELTSAHYEAMGGMERVVQTAVDEVLSVDPDERRDQLAALRAAFIPWLATINPDNGQPMRRVARESDLPHESQQLINAFVEKRLLVKDRRGSEVVVEVALESLLRQWKDLASWLRDERKNLIAVGDIERAATGWHTNHNDPAWLLTGTRLTDAETLKVQSGYQDRLAQQPTHDYLTASRQTEDERLAKEEEQRLADVHHAQERQHTAEAHAADLRRRSRTLRAVVVGTAVIAVIAVVGALIAAVMYGRADREAHDALAAKLDSEAGSVFSGAIVDSDVHALADTLAAQQLRSDPGASRPAFYTATTALNTTRVIVPTPAAIRSVAFSPNGQMLASAGTDDTVRVWDLTDPAHPSPVGPPLTGHTSAVTKVAFSPDGHTLISASTDHTIRFWNLTDPAHPSPLCPPLTGHTEAVDSLAFSPDGHTLVSASDDHTIRFWNLTDPAHPSPLGPPLTGHTDAVDSLAFSPDGHTLATGSDDASVQLWNVADPAHPSPLGPPLTGYTNWVSSVAFSPDGHTLATGSANAVRLWNVVDAAHPASLGQPLSGHTGTVYDLAFSPDGHTVASGSDDATIRLWNLDTALPLTGHTGYVRKVAFSPDGHTLASCSDDATIRLWNLSDPEHPRPFDPPLTGHTDAVEGVAFSPDGRTLASASADHTIRLWSVTDPARPRPLGPPLTGHTNWVTSVAFSPDGRTLASGSTDDTVRLWNLIHPGPLGSPLIAHSGGVYGVTFSPDGQTLATGGLNSTVRLWNLTDPVHPSPLGPPLTGHTDAVVSLAFSPDGRTLASGSSDDKIRLWNVIHPGPLGSPLIGHSGAVYGVTFSPDGHTLASASADDKIRLWDLSDVAHPGVLGAPLTGQCGVQSRRAHSGLQRLGRNCAVVAHPSRRHRA